MAQQVPLDPAAVTGEAQDDGTIEVAPDLAYQRLAIVNVVFYGVPGGAHWVLVDAGSSARPGASDASPPNGSAPVRPPPSS